MAFDVDAVRRALVREIHDASRSHPKIDLQRYLGSPHRVLGLSVPQMRAILRNFAAEHRDLSPRHLNRLADELWAGETFEEKALATMLVDRYRKVRNADTWRILDRWVDHAVGWGLCDGLAAGPIASIVHADPRRFKEVLRWTRSQNVWRRRASTYALRDYVVAKELDRPLLLLERLLYDEEFWVQRAVGTWLRECWKRDRKRTEAFLNAHVPGLPPVVVTVATERAPKSFRIRLRRANQATRDARRSRGGRPARRRPRRD